MEAGDPTTNVLKRIPVADNSLLDIYEEKYAPKVPFPVLLRHPPIYDRLRLIPPKDWALIGVASTAHFPVGYFWGIGTAGAVRIPAAWGAVAFGFMGTLFIAIARSDLRIAGRMENARELEILRKAYP